jgi:hypothetical protein
VVVIKNRNMHIFNKSGFNFDFFIKSFVSNRVVLDRFVVKILPSAIVR